MSPSIWAKSPPYVPEQEATLDDNRTVQQHLQACAKMESLITDRNALLNCLSNMLQQTRSILESLREYQHPKIRMDLPYSMRRNDSNQRDICPVDLIELHIKQINALLGDRA